MEELLGRYRLLSLIATGGMGEVFLARQEGPAGFSKTVVVKRILRHLAGDQGFIDLFLNEARLAAQLQHPHIAQVFGLEREGDTWFMAMEYVHGHSLRAVLDQAEAKHLPVPTKVALRLLSQALEGLHFAHELTDEAGRPLGILHRDVSPDNVLVSYAGSVKLVDFGIARAMGRSGAQVGRARGKLPYMAPEQTHENATLDRRADVYGAGVLLYEVLSGVLPPGVPQTPEELERPPQPYTPSPLWPDAVNEVLRRALAPTAGERFATALEMSQALEGILSARREAVLPGEIAAYLGALFGRHSSDRNPAVAMMEAPQGRTDVLNRDRTEPLNDGGDTAALEGRARWALPVAGLAVLVGVALGAAFLARAPGQTPPPALPTPAVTPAAPLPEPAPVAPETDLTALPKPETRPPLVRPVGPKHAPAAAHGLVALRVNPWARVSVNGRDLGVTPLPPLELPAGVQVLTLTNPQLGVTRKVKLTVRPGATTPLKVDLFEP